MWLLPSEQQVLRPMPTPRLVMVRVLELQFRAISQALVLVLALASVVLRRAPELRMMVVLLQLLTR
eukprot:COSAG02_NODE_6671_length_3427_cov_2.969050_2_plen_66_part_00